MRKEWVKLGVFIMSKGQYIRAERAKGYVIVGEGDSEVIVPARVSIFRINKNKEKHEGTDG